MRNTELLTVMSTVEQDHHLVLGEMQALKVAMTCLSEPGDAGTIRRLDRLRHSNEFFATRFASHLEEEEATLFPLLERHQPGGAELVARLRRDHAEILCKREEFGNCLRVATELEDGLTRTVLWDLLAYGWELLEQLDIHAHTETHAIHECLVQSVKGEAVPCQG